jgi:hypothetical protein
MTDKIIKLLAYDNLIENDNKKLLELQKERKELSDQLKLTTYLCEFYMMIYKNFTYNKFNIIQLSLLCHDNKVSKYSSVMSYLNRLVKKGYIEVSKEGGKKLYNIKEIKEESVNNTTNVVKENDNEKN